jgi:hypothetical protein
MKRVASSSAFLLASSILAGDALHIGVAIADQPRVHPVETYTVVYKQTGLVQGTLTVHSRHFGYQRVEIADVVVTTGTLKLPMKQRTVIDGDKVTSIDEDARSAEVTTDPSFEKMVQAMSSDGGVGAVDSIMKTVWNATPTGKAKTFAGETCDEFASAEKKQVYCTTNDGILVYIDQGTAGTRFVRTAIEVRRNDGGADEDFQIPADIVTESP